MPYETEPACRTSQPWTRCEWVTSQTRRDLPTPGSPTMATTWPCPAAGSAERLTELLQLRLPPDEAGETPGRGGMEPGPQRPGPGQLVHLDGRL